MTMYHVCEKVGFNNPVMQIPVFASSYVAQYETPFFPVVNVSLRFVPEYPNLLYGKVNPSVLIGSFLVRISPYGPFPWKRSSAVYFLVFKSRQI